MQLVFTDLGWGRRIWEGDFPHCLRLWGKKALLHIKLHRISQYGEVHRASSPKYRPHMLWKYHHSLAGLTFTYTTAEHHWSEQTNKICSTAVLPACTRYVSLQGSCEVAYWSYKDTSKLSSSCHRENGGVRTMSAPTGLNVPSQHDLGPNPTCPAPSLGIPEHLTLA